MLAKLYDILTILLIVTAIGVTIYVVINRDKFFNSGFFNPNHSSIYENLVKKPIKISSKWLPDNLALRDKEVYVNENINIILFGGGLNSPQKIEIVERDLVLVSEPTTGNIVVLKDIDGDYSADNKDVFVSNLNKPYGISYYNKDLYVATETSILKYPDFISQYSARTFDVEVLVRNLPAGGLNPFKSLLVGPGEKIFVGISSSCDVCIETDKRRGSIVSYNLDGTQEEIYATGFRQINDLEFFTGFIYEVDNSQIAHEASDEINKVSKGNFYGWPVVYNTNTINEDISLLYDENKYTSPLYEFSAKTNPTGLAVIENKWDINTNSFLVTSNGNSTYEDTSKKVLVYNLEENSLDTLVSFWTSEEEFIANPVDITKYKTGYLVVDELNGNVYYLH